MSSEPDLKNLAELLRRRIEIIGDHAWRDADAEAHLEALKNVSLEIEAAHQSMADQLPFRLNHFLERCSYDKALAFIEEGDTGH